MKTEWFVYVLKSLRDGKLYIGISMDPERRLQEHNKGKTKSTKSRRPFKLIYREKCGTLEKARSLEKYYKTGFGREKLKELIPR